MQIRAKRKTRLTKIGFAVAILSRSQRLTKAKESSVLDSATVSSVDVFVDNQPDV